MQEERITGQLPIWKGGRIVAYALVDAVDLPTLNCHRWRFMGTWPRVARTERRRAIYLARALLGLDYGDPRQADHINRDPLDNRRTNLRIVTRAQQLQNRGLFANNTSGYRGVGWDKTHQRWQAYGKVNGRMVGLGRFTDIEDARKAATAFRVAHLPFLTDAEDGR